jgi:hypothetical protein
VAHGVAGRERGRDDRRAEHQPDDDQGGAAAAPGEAADAEAEEDAIAQREYRDRGKRQEEQDGQDDRQGFHG